MMTTLLLWYVGMQIAAPTWYFAVLVVIALFKIFGFGLEMFKLGAN